MIYIPTTIFSKLEPPQWSTIRMAECISSSLSVAGIFFILFTTLMIKRLRTRPEFRLIIYLSIADLIWSFTGVLALFTSINNEPIYCSITAAAYYYSYLSSFFWTSVFAYSVYRLTKYDAFLMEESENILLCLGFLLPIIICSIIYFLGDYGPSEGQGCILKGNLNKEQYLIVDIISLFIPIVFTIIFNVFCFVKAVSHLDRIAFARTVRKLAFSLLPYPLIFIITWSGMVVYYIYYDITEDEPYILILLSSVIVKLQGFFNSIVYGFNKNVRRGIKALFRCHINEETRFNQTFTTSVPKMEIMARGDNYSHLLENIS